MTAGRWLPNREPLTPASTSWQSFIDRLGLRYQWDETEHLIMIEGADGWAFTAAIRLEEAAHELGKAEPEVYWSGYYLLAQVIEKARTDPEFLKTIEALAVGHLYGIDGEQFPQAQFANDRGGRVSNAVIQATLKSLGVWPQESTRQPLSKGAWDP